MVEPMTGNAWGPPAPAPPPERERLRWWAWASIVVAGLLGLFVVGMYTWPFFAEVTPPVTRDDAYQHVRRVADAAVARDFAKLCRLERDAQDCESALAAGARDNAPTERPTVDLRNEHEGRVWLFVVRGRDGRGERFESEVVVRREGGRGAVAVNAVFWTGARVDPAELS